MNQMNQMKRREEEEFNPIDVIWTKYGWIWYPDQIYSFNGQGLIQALTDLRLPKVKTLS